MRVWVCHDGLVDVRMKTKSSSTLSLFSFVFILIATVFGVRSFDLNIRRFSFSF